jgi:mannose-1-phosphate guanylyltransferase / mannose-6-phosphate isomerase
VVYEASVKTTDDTNNAISGNVIAVDTQNCLIHAGKRLVTTLGVSDLAIIDTPDALLIMQRGQSQKVRELAEQIEQRGGTEHIEHQTVQHSWGSCHVLDDATGYKVRRFDVMPGEQLDLLGREHRGAHWVVVAGVATITRGEKRADVKENESIYMPAGEKCNLENLGRDVISVVEVHAGGSWVRNYTSKCGYEPERYTERKASIQVNQQ